MGKKITVAIDAGHGKNTAGKRCLKALDPNETREWVLNERIARYVCEHLNAAGVRTLRMDDPTGAIDVPLAERTAKANAAKCDYYISIHADSGINGGKGGGITAFAFPTASSKSFALRDAVYKHMIAETGLAGNRVTPRQTNDYWVLRKTSMPAMLVECGFMDSATDVPIILTDQFARKAAKGIANGFFATVGIDFNDKDSALEELAAVVQKRFKFENDTMSYLEKYEHAEELMRRLAHGE